MEYKWLNLLFFIICETKIEILNQIELCMPLPKAILAVCGKNCGVAMVAMKQEEDSQALWPFAEMLDRGGVMSRG